MDLQMMGLYPTRLLRSLVNTNVNEEGLCDEQEILKRLEGNEQFQEVRVLKRGRLMNPDKVHEEGSVSSVQYVDYCCT